LLLKIGDVVKGQYKIVKKIKTQTFNEMFEAERVGGAMPSYENKLVIKIDKQNAKQ
jgi:hypothetical protein